jgi:hypothetical protein
LRLATVLLVGTLIREAFSFWTGHPFDFELWVRLGYYTFRGVNPYGVLPAAPGLSFADVFSITSTATIGYLPFWPFVTAAMYGLYTLVGFGNPYVYYFLLKQPIIFGDIALAYLLYRLVREEKPERAVWAAEVWAFLPLSIVFSGVWGMFDSLAMALVLASLLSEYMPRSALLSGLATFAKSVPLVFAAPLTLGRPGRWWALIIAVLFPASMTLLVLAVMGWPLSGLIRVVGSTLGKGGGSMSWFDVFGYLQYLGVIVPQTLDQLWFLGYLWIPAVLIGTVLAVRAFGLKSTAAVVRVMLVVTLLFLIFKSQVNEQYSVYLLSLGILDVCLIQPKRLWLVMVTAVVVFVYLVTNNLLLIRFVAPVYHEATLLDFTLDLEYAFYRFTVALVAGFAFTALNVVYLAWIWKDRHVSEKPPATSRAEVRGSQRFDLPTPPV